MAIGLCSACGGTKKVSWKKAVGRYFCVPCRRRLFSLDQCVKCTHYGQVASRDDNGGAICLTCYNDNLHFGLCDRCGKDRARRYNWNGGRICRQCRHVVKPSRARSLKKVENCSLCGLNLPVCRRVGGRPYCAGCNKKKFHSRICGVCGEKKIVTCRVGRKRACQKCKKNSKHRSV